MNWGEYFTPLYGYEEEVDEVWVSVLDDYKRGGRLLTRLQELTTDDERQRYLASICRVFEWHG